MEISTEILALVEHITSLGMSGVLLVVLFFLWSDYKHLRKELTTIQNQHREDLRLIALRTVILADDTASRRPPMPIEGD